MAISVWYSSFFKITLNIPAHSLAPSLWFPRVGTFSWPSTTLGQRLFTAPVGVSAHTRSGQPGFRSDRAIIMPPFLRLRSLNSLSLFSPHAFLQRHPRPPAFVPGLFALRHPLLQFCPSHRIPQHEAWEDRHLLAPLDSWKKTFFLPWILGKDALCADLPALHMFSSCYLFSGWS